MSTHTLHVVNIKCGGCGQRITEALEKLGASNVHVSPEEQTVVFDGADKDAVAKKLDKMGYPQADSNAASRLDKKAKSYVSCAIGRWG